MAAAHITKLFPPDGELTDHKDLYLKQDLRLGLESDESAYVYANFIVSLDGRIAIPDPEGEGVTLATDITNDRDWRLFQELAVQADVLITSGRYLRDYKAGPKQELLQVYDDPAFEDLGRWRRDRGLSDYPAIAVISRSLDFEVPSPLQEPGRELYVFTTQSTERTSRDALTDAGAELVIAGDDDVSGKALVAGLQEKGHRLIYSTAGPRILHLLLAENVLDRLYLTIAHSLLGGDPFSSILEGSLLSPAAGFSLHSLFYDPTEPNGVGQFYAAFDRRKDA